MKGSTAQHMHQPFSANPNPLHDGFHPLAVLSVEVAGQPLFNCTSKIVHANDWKDYHAIFVTMLQHLGACFPSGQPSPLPNLRIIRYDTHEASQSANAMWTIQSDTALENRWGKLKTMPQPATPETLKIVPLLEIIVQFKDHKSISLKRSTRSNHKYHDSLQDVLKCRWARPPLIANEYYESMVQNEFAERRAAKLEKEPKNKGSKRKREEEDAEEEPAKKPRTDTEDQKQDAAELEQKVGILEVQIAELEEKLQKVRKEADLYESFLNGAYEVADKHMKEAVQHEREARVHKQQAGRHENRAMMYKDKAGYYETELKLRVKVEEYNRVVKSYKDARQSMGFGLRFMG